MNRIKMENIPPLVNIPNVKFKSVKPLLCKNRSKENKPIFFFICRSISNIYANMLTYMNMH